MVSKQIKSKQRVSNHGEVFTSEREVNAMLDLVKQETERIDSRFLEPACGDGNFLAEILRRKLDVAKKKYRKSPFDYEINAVLAATSIYGVDILMDNVIACRERMFKIWDNEYKAVCKKEVNEDCRKSVQFIFRRNIVCGNALSLKKVDENGNDTDEPIVFSEWAFITRLNLQSSDYTFDKLMKGDNEARDIFESKQKNYIDTQMTLFSESEQQNDKLNADGEFLKKYISHYRRIWEHDE